MFLPICKYAPKLTLPRRTVMENLQNGEIHKICTKHFEIEEQGHCQSEKLRHLSF